MFPAPSLLTLGTAMARHAGHVHQTVSSNLARADVPGATAEEAGRFADALRGEAMRARDTGERISVEREMVAMAQNAGRHDAAVAIWSKTLDLVRLAGASPR